MVGVGVGGGEGQREGVAAEEPRGGLIERAWRRMRYS